MRKQKNNGITLIALVITIIVLLILAGVSIATLTGDNGILTKASEASKQTEIAEVKEKAQTDILAKQTENEGNISKEEFVEILNKYFNDVPTAEELPEDLSTLILTTKDEYGNHDINISEIWNGTFPKTIESLKAGDKVYYDTGVSSVGNNGVVECVVLYDSSSKYGVQIITKDVVDTVTLGNQDPKVTGANNFEKSRNSYNRALKTLYEKAQEYLNPTYATSSRCIGSKPDDPDWDAIEEEATYYTLNEGDIYYYEYMVPYYGTFKNQDGNNSKDNQQIRNIENLIKSNDDYWIASRSIYPGSKTNVIFYLDYIDEQGGATGVDWLSQIVESNTNGSYKTYSRGFRPVVTLKSGLKITGGDGVDTPYTLEP